MSGEYVQRALTIKKKAEIYKQMCAAISETDFGKERHSYYEQFKSEFDSCILSFQTTDQFLFYKVNYSEYSVLLIFEELATGFVANPTSFQKLLEHIVEKLYNSTVTIKQSFDPSSDPKKPRPVFVKYGSESIAEFVAKDPASKECRNVFARGILLACFPFLMDLILFKEWKQKRCKIAPGTEDQAESSTSPENNSKFVPEPAAVIELARKTDQTAEVATETRKTEETGAAPPMTAIEEENLRKIAKRKLKLNKNAPLFIPTTAQSSNNKTPNLTSDRKRSDSKSRSKQTKEEKFEAITKQAAETSSVPLFVQLKNISDAKSIILFEKWKSYVYEKNSNLIRNRIDFDSEKLSDIYNEYQNLEKSLNDYFKFRGLTMVARLIVKNVKQKLTVHLNGKQTSKHVIAMPKTNVFADSKIARMFGFISLCQTYFADFYDQLVNLANDWKHNDPMAFHLENIVLKIDNFELNSQQSKQQNQSSQKQSVSLIPAQNFTNKPQEQPPLKTAQKVVKSTSVSVNKKSVDAFYGLFGLLPTKQISKLPKRKIIEKDTQNVKSGPLHQFFAFEPSISLLQKKQPFDQSNAFLKQRINKEKAESLLKRRETATFKTNLQFETFGRRQFRKRVLHDVESINSVNTQYFDVSLTNVVKQTSVTKLLPKTLFSGPESIRFEPIHNFLRQAIGKSLSIEIQLGDECTTAELIAKAQQSSNEQMISRIVAKSSNIESVLQCLMLRTAESVYFPNKNSAT